MLQADLAPGFGDVMMLMSRPGNLPVYSHKATTKADIETEKQDSPETESPKSAKKCREKVDSVPQTAEPNANDDMFWSKFLKIYFPKHSEIK